MSVPNVPPTENGPGDVEPPDDAVLAGELVLGVLDATERTAAQGRRDSEAAFAMHVARWERNFSPWVREVQAIPVPARVWHNIRARLGWTRDVRQPTGWWNSLSLWRAVAACAAVFALVLWVTRPVLNVMPNTKPSPIAVAEAAKPVTTLAHEDGTPGWLASIDRERGTVLIVPVPAPPDQNGRVAELWIIPSGQAPRSLGAVSSNTSYTVLVPQPARGALVSGSVLAITLEPAAGVPHRAPTGPIIAKGVISG